MNYISFSLYGRDPKYLIGAVENAKFVKEHLSEWQCVFYCDNDIELDLLAKLESQNAILRIRDSTWHANGMFWRFRVFQDFEFDFAIIRDCDSRLSTRDVCATSDWIRSGLTFHILRDHPYHNALIMGGLWGATSEILKLPIDWEKQKEYGLEHGDDQRFLADVIYPFTKKCALVQDDFFHLESKTFKISCERLNSEYLGEAFSASGDYIQKLRKYLEHAQTSKWIRMELYLWSTKRRVTYLLARIFNNRAR